MKMEKAKGYLYAKWEESGTVVVPRELPRVGGGHGPGRRPRGPT